jgi:hypothetical protein
MQKPLWLCHSEVQTLDVSPLPALSVTASARAQKKVVVGYTEGQPGHGTRTVTSSACR